MFINCQGFGYDSLLHVCGGTLKMKIFSLEKTLNSISFCLYEPCNSLLRGKEYMFHFVVF